MNTIRKTLSLVLPFALLSSIAARADFSVSAVGLLNVSNTSNGPSAGTTTSAEATGGFGALGSMSLFPGFSAELGALYVPRKVTTKLAGVPVATLTSNSLEIPLLLRFTGLPIISFGAGLYYATALGNGSLTTPLLKDASYNYGANGRSSSDFGLVASVAAHFPILPMISLFGDARYLLGFTNQLSSGAIDMQYRDFQFLAGLSFGL